MLKAQDKKAIDFIKDNYSFFTAPLLDQHAYQTWMASSNLESEAKGVSSILLDALNIDRPTTAQYIDALIGQSINITDLESVQYFNDDKLIALFESNKVLTDSINKIKNSLVIAQWNLDHAKIVSKRTLLNQHSSLIQDVEQKISDVRLKSINLSQRGFTQDAKVADTLANKMTELLKSFIDSPADVDIKARCTPIINNAKQSLNSHRGWGQVLTNLALAVAGLGVIYLAAGLINKATTGHFLFFNQTDTFNQVTTLENSFDNLSQNLNASAIVI
tara:strand:+ start:187 stop:1011 length:825 start_codon:yes stop_codon:yes gene_type:complete